MSKPANTSSAELTAHYRCAFPELSHDSISKLLAPDTSAKAFIEKYHYELAPRKISVLAGFFLDQATELLNSGKYDSVISFASGFSMLTYLIAQRQADRSGITYIDSDVPDMIEERNARMAKAFADIEKIQTMAFDIEQAFVQGRSIKTVFSHCQRPIFILDGVSYFLTPNCVEWLLEEISSYEQAAILLYYWPNDMEENSALFAKVFADLKQGQDFREDLISFWDNKTREKFAKLFPIHQDFSLAEIEKLVCQKNGVEELLLTDPNLFFPVRATVGQTK